MPLFLGVSSASAQSQPLVPTTQEGGPIVVGEEAPKFKGVELIHLEAALDFWNQWTNDRLKQTGQPTLTEKEALYRQTLDLIGEASIGHKNLVDLSFNLKLGLEEDSLHSGQEGTSRSYISTTDLYDVRALFLANGPVPTTLYARRDEIFFHQDFGGLIRGTVTEFGAIAEVRSAIAPTMAQVFHREQDQTDQLNRGDFRYTQDSAIIHSDVHISDSQRLLADYTFDHINETSGVGDTKFHDDYDQHDATITHWLYLGPQDLDSLRSSLRIENRSGTFAEQIERLDEELILQHGPKLESHYNLSLEDLNRQDIEQRLVRGSALVRHRLFDSLTSTASVGGSALEVPGEFNTDEVFANGAMDYTKAVPYGRFDAGLALGGIHQDNSERGTAVPVVNGTFVFNDPFPVTINRRNIVPEAIVVRDTARLRVFINGLDYTVQVFPDRAELTRVIGGAISNGQAVSIDFDVGPEPANQIDSTTWSLSVRYDITEGALAGLGVYTIYRQLDQHVHAADPSRFVLDNVRDVRFGAQYTNSGLTLTAEGEHHESNISPFDSVLLQGQYSQRFSRTSLVTVSLSGQQVDYRSTGERVELYLLNGRWTQKMGEELDFSIHGQGRLENHTISPDIQGVEGGLDLNWHRGQTTIYGSIFASMLNAGPTNTLSEALTFGLRRSF